VSLAAYRERELLGFAAHPDCTANPKACTYTSEPLSGLSGPATAAHLHGPSGFLKSASVLVDLEPFNGGAFAVIGEGSTLTPSSHTAVENGADAHPLTP
jgi:hypothetical protein